MLFKSRRFTRFKYHETWYSTETALMSDFFLRELGINKFITIFMTLFLELHNSDYFYDMTFTDRGSPHKLQIGFPINFFLSKQVFLHDVFFWNLVRLIKIKHIKAYNVKKGLPFTSKRTHFGNKNSRKTLTFFKDFMPRRENNIKLIINRKSYYWR